MYMQLQINNHHANNSHPKQYVFTGPSAETEQEQEREHDHEHENGCETCEAEPSSYTAYFTIKAYSPLHAKYVAAVEFCTQGASSPENRTPSEDTYAYPVTDFMDELIAEGASLSNAIQVFARHSLGPYYILPFEDYEVDGTEPV